MHDRKADPSRGSHPYRLGDDPVVPPVSLGYGVAGGIDQRAGPIAERHVGQRVRKGGGGIGPERPITDGIGHGQSVFEEASGLA
jgi:hypothetical protein